MLLILTCLLVWAFRALPPELRFWQALQGNEPIGYFTSVKLNRLIGDPVACQQYLREAGVSASPIADNKAGVCPLMEQMHLQKSHIAYSNTVNATCPLLAALTLWEREVVIPAAQQHLRSDIIRMEHMGIFSCRNVRGSSSRRSEHAAANAIDISAFATDDGRMISVERDWRASTPKGEFLRAVHRGACRIFRGSLGPDYNSLHANHFHFDLGRFTICR